MSADGLVECNWTPGAGDVLSLAIRRTDDANQWVTECSQSGSTMRLLEVNAGVTT